MEGLRKKEKALMDMDNSMAIAGGKGGVSRVNGNGKLQQRLNLFKNESKG